MLNQKSINLIKSFEGVRLSCYHLGDGVCTIGYGHTRPLSQCAGAGSWRITAAQAEQLLQDDLKIYVAAVKGYFTRQLNGNQLGALTSFCYNLGTAIFVKYNFPHNGSDIDITSQMMLFCNKGTQFEEGITRRRKAEVALFLAKDSQDTQPIPKPKKKGKKMKTYKFEVEGESGTFFFDGEKTFVFTGKNAKAAADHYEGVYNEIMGEKIKAGARKSKAQFKIWNAVYPAKYIDVKL